MDTLTTQSPSPPQQLQSPSTCPYPRSRCSRPHLRSPHSRRKLCSVYGFDVCDYCGTFAAIASTVAIVFTLYKGVDLLHFDENAKANVKTLVDDYNSYSANAASAVGRLISFVVGLVVQVVIVRFASNWALRDRSTRRFTLVEFVAVAAVEYLVLNSFNALNVQLNPVQIRPVIYPSDLSIT